MSRYRWPPKLAAFSYDQWKRSADASLRQTFLRWRLTRIVYLESLGPESATGVAIEREHYRRDLRIFNAG